MTTVDCDYLVIGSGLAGLMSAIRLSSHGRVTVAMKCGLYDGNTDRAQGGIACVTDPEDSVESHVRDTLETGNGLCDERVVRAIVEAAPDRIRELESLGVHFDRRNGDRDSYDLGREAGHSRRRVLHVGDLTGHEIMQALTARARDLPGVTFLPHHMAIDLVTTGWLGRPGPNRCIGAYFLDRTRNEIKAIRATHTVLATGGAGKVYLYTSNPDLATGDGMAMAHRAGLPIKNMEFVQFHPTCLYHPEAKSFLISEAVRGEGGELINSAGEAFAKKYDERGSLAPRDVVARAIDQEMKTRGDRCVYLDITHKSEDFIAGRFPHIHATCRAYGVDMAKEPIPVVPAAHYCCGGVEAEIDGHTALEGLWVCGETACTGMHGANRLASNSLLEALVCAGNMAERLGALPGGRDREKIEIPAWRSGHAVPSDEAVVVEHNWNEVRTCMWDYVGIVRTNKRLERAKRRLVNLRQEIRQYYRDYLVTADMLELRNIAEVGELIVRSAMARKESRGLHYTLDYPESDSRHTPQETRMVDTPGDNTPLW